jgi:exodeoxyribonuclease VII small subunit
MTPNPDAQPIDGDPSRPPDWRYETTVTEIETIINQIEAGDLDLADVFEQFAQAVQYLRQCETFLAERQGQLDLLIEELGDEPEF